MIVERAEEESASQRSVLRMIAIGTMMALVISVAIVVVSRWVGHPAHPALGAAMGVVAATSHAAAQIR
jgi:hypothetical protein